MGEEVGRESDGREGGREIGQEDGEGPTLLHPHVRIVLSSFLVESMSMSLSMAIFLIFLFSEWKNSSKKNCFHKRAADGTRERVPH